MDNMELLQAIQSMINEIQSFKSELAQDIHTMDQRLQKIEADNSTMRDDLRSMQADVIRLPLLEQNIALVLEGQSGMNEQLQVLQQMSKDMEDVRIKVTALEEVTRSHTSQIKELRVAK